MVIEYNQEIVDAIPKVIRLVCEAAGKDGWALAGMLAVMLPPSARRDPNQLASGLFLAETVPDEDVHDSLRGKAQLAKTPIPAVMLMFQREVPPPPEPPPEKSNAEVIRERLRRQGHVQPE